MLEETLKNTIRDIIDFPKEGVVFKDITPILADHKLTKQVVRKIAKLHQEDSIDAVVGIESRGFWFGIMLANELAVPFIPIRKKGKLPYLTVTQQYNLEYGVDEIEMHKDAIQKNWNILVHDDLLATGGTAQAAAELILKQSATVIGFSFVVELCSFNGRKVLSQYTNKITQLVQF